MLNKLKRAQLEYGDFQTPLELATQVCQKLKALGIAPEIILEPTCGVGAFVKAATNAFPNAKKIIGVEVKGIYLEALESQKKHLFQSERINLIQGDFFDFDWETLLAAEGSLLVLGNFPWVTNSQQGAIGGTNLPKKHNFQKHKGLDSRTGKSNFDISEWMLLQAANWLKKHQGCLAMLCKTAVARKFLRHLHTDKVGVLRAALYGIDAKRYFGASVEACLLFCEFAPQCNNYDYAVYETIDSTQSKLVGHRKGLTVRDLATFEKLSNYYGYGKTKWRSGIKHDCSDVMEFRKTDDYYINGLGEVVEIEPFYLYPLLKGSDLANKRVEKTRRYVLVPQKTVGEATNSIKELAPKTWAYLEAHAKYLDARKSKIYQASPRFSIFGVGPYTFAPFKVAICGLYKKLEFHLIRQIATKSVVFDDTVYFLSFETEQEADKVLNILNLPLVNAFYSALIFWDEKRPIKSSILNSLNLQQFESTQTIRLF